MLANATDAPSARSAALPGSRALSALLVLGGIAAVAWRWARFGGYYPDDTYITFRFAKHLADGAGLVWNLGGERVEGFTSPLHVWLLALGRLAGLPLGTASALVSGAALLVLIGLFVACVRRGAGRFGPEAALLLSLYLVAGHLSVHVGSGIDTLLFMGLAAGSFATSLGLAASPTAARAAGLAGINLLALLGRPDAAPFLAGQGLVLGLFGIQRWRRDADLRLLRAACASFGGVAVVGALYLSWKLSYFGYLLPNSFYVKASAPGTFAGVRHVTRFLEDAGVRYLLWLVPLFALVDGRKLRAAARRPRTRETAALLAVPVACFLVFYTTTLHAVCYRFRFEYPMAFFLALVPALVLGVGAPLDRSYAWLARRLPAAAALAAIVLPLLALPTWAFWRDVRDEDFGFRDMQVLHYEPIADALRRSGAGSRGTVVFDSAGFIPFASGFSHIDPIGLTDNTLSGREPITAVEREEYIWGKRPDVYLGPVPPASAGAGSAAQDPRIESTYVDTVLLQRAPFAEYRRIFEPLSPEERREVLHQRMRELRDHWVAVGEIPYPFPHPPEYTHFIYVRRDSPFAAELIRELEPLVHRRLQDFDFADPLPGAKPR